MNSECQIFRAMFNKLHADMESAPADTAKLAIKLYSSTIVGKGVRDTVVEAATPSKAASKLLGAVETWVESHPQEIGSFFDCLGSFPTWQEHVEDFARRLKEMEIRMVKPMPVSEPFSSPADLGMPSSGLQQQPLDIRLYISSSGDTKVGPVHGQPSQEKVFELRSAPAHRKHSQLQEVDFEAGSVTPGQPGGGKLFQHTASPLTNSTRTLSPGLGTASCSLSVVAKEATSNGNSLTDDETQPQRLTSLVSQTSTSSALEEDMMSIKGSLDQYLTKCCSLISRLKSENRALRAEQVKEKKEFAAAIEAANQETNELRKQVYALKYKNRELSEELESTRESVVDSNKKKKQLMEQLRDSYDELKHRTELCSKLEAQVKAVAGEANFMQCQQQEERVRELEDELEAYRKTNAELEDKIQLLEMEVNFLLGSGSSSEEWALNPEQEDSGGLDSI